MRGTLHRHDAENRDLDHGKRAHPFEPEVGSDEYFG